MQLNTRIIIEQNPNLKRYLKENSYWYKYLNRNGDSLKIMYQEMKKQYKLTTSDKLEKVNDNIKLVSEMFNLLK